jgi:hypothetical protein
VRTRAWPFLAIAACCVINGSHYLPTLTRAQTRLAVRETELPVTAAWFNGNSHIFLI